MFAFDFEKESALTLERLWPRVEDALPDGKERAAFRARLDTHFPAIFRLLHGVYGGRYDFLYHLEQILLTAARAYVERPPDLKELDSVREADPQWFQGEDQVGGVCYVDLFAGDLNGIREKIPYFKELGLTYLHLMPLFKCPEENSDGGYAISSFREVNPALGTMDDLRALAADLRAEGISLVLDFVFNHTSDEHDWALRAIAGEEAYQGYYWLFPDRTLPDKYEQNLREIFPDQAPGSFTYQPDLDRWVWTTFHRFQWDLNYANPAVFTAMFGEMLFLANVGAEVLRLDAVAFIWKKLGTSCEGLPEVHTIIQAFNALVRVAAPAMLFKSEAIVHPDEVAKYVRWEEAPISYNPTLMALLWETLATRNVRLLSLSMQKRFGLPEGCAWVNYVRCHDDIGWTFADEDAAELGINGFDHRQFLNRFYTGEFPGSFAKGLPFNYNPQTLDMRISGMCASLAGLEQAIERHNPLYIEMALRRIELIHAIIISAGGIPLIYLGDEIAMVNNYDYVEESGKAEDSRWVHRQNFDWQQAESRHDNETVSGRIFSTLRKLIAIRKSTPAFANGESVFFDSGSDHVLAYTRHGKSLMNGQVLILANFSEEVQTIHLVWLPRNAYDLVTGMLYTKNEITLAPYEFLWLKGQES